MELAFIAALGFLKVESIKVISDSINYSEYITTVNTLQNEIFNYSGCRFIGWLRRK